MNKRKEIYSALDFMVKTKKITLTDKDKRPSFAKLARKYNCDYRTVKRAYEKAISSEKESNDVPKRKSKIDPYIDIINSKIQTGAPAIAIFKYLKEYTSYDGGYSTVKNYIHSLHAEKVQKAVVRFETSPGLQVQIDRKESMKFRTKSGDIIKFNVFLAILGYSRYKFLRVTETRDYGTIQSCIIQAISFFRGAPKEWLFDNMRSIIDKARTIGEDPVFNEKFITFCRDACFEPKACVAYRPCTKGKVETLARLMNRLKVYSGDIENFKDIETIVKKLNTDLNDEVCQATGKKPIDLYKKEKEYLTDVNLNALTGYFVKAEYRKVSKESLITYEGKKYSVPPKYIGKTVEIEDEGDYFTVTYEGHYVYKREKDDKLYHFLPSDYMRILKASDLGDLEDETLCKIARRNLDIYDKL